MSMFYSNNGIYYHNGRPQPAAPLCRDEARKNTIAHGILAAHNMAEGADALCLRFDALISHDITYVGIIQTARASGMTEFPVPYVLTNCHNSLCAVGGTINADDHAFGLSAAKKYGGIFVPANLAVIHAYARERLATCGGMILGSDSHTRYGALGCMGIGEGGPELVKQLLQKGYDPAAPQVILVHVTGAPRRGVGPQDVALALIKTLFPEGRAKNKILEFRGTGIQNLSVDFRNAIDVMTTESTCLSSIWETDETVRAWYAARGREDAYKPLQAQACAYYDGHCELDLSAIEPMIALPFHPSNAHTIREFLANAAALLAGVEEESKKLFPNCKARLMDKIRDGGVYAEQGIIAGCAGGSFENLAEAAAILAAGGRTDSGFSLSVYPQSLPAALALSQAGAGQTLLREGAVIKPAFCGPCFGAGDVPAANALSLRHSTRNFPNREGSKPNEGQLSFVALMDARSIAATARNGGRITPADTVDYDYTPSPEHFDASAYDKRVYDGYGKPIPETELVMGSNIADWPRFPPLPEHMLLRLCAVLRDPVTTTDELIPSGEISSYRSNPERLSQFALSRRAPDYVPQSKAVRAAETARRAGKPTPELRALLARVDADPETTGYYSCIFANKPGDGSAREQAASCQRVLGGAANICREFATKRYRSNCVNWGILPLTVRGGFDADEGDCIFIQNLRRQLAASSEAFEAVILHENGASTPIKLYLEDTTAQERALLLTGCLMNYYKEKEEMHA
ncbi:MAG: hydratase [Clostridiales bacterium]|nr:hydratase [Clostridiales bacterium]